MTLRLVAEREGIPLEGVEVTLHHDRRHADDCAAAAGKCAQIEVIERVVTLEGDLTPAQRDRMLAIADKCPVHRTLMGDLRVETRLAD
jgi:putative redox protein